MCDIKSYSQLKKKKELKKEQLTYLKARLCADCYQLTYTTEKVRNGYVWWKRIMLGVEVYKQAGKIFQHFKKQRPTKNDIGEKCAS